MDESNEPKARRLATSRQLADHYKKTSRTFLRWMADPALNFPRPALVIHGRNYWDWDDIEAWEAAQRHRPIRAFKMAGAA